MFYQSLISDWNHGNAHFLRGIAAELIKRDNEVIIYEPIDSWSMKNLLTDYGTQAIDEFYKYYPQLNSIRYDIVDLDLNEVLSDADMVIVHEWNSHELVKMIGRHKKRTGTYKLFFHDTHHRMITDKESMHDYELKYYDGVLAYGKILKDMYLKENRTKNSWTWHEAADTNIFYPRESKIEGDVVWIGNWGDNERSEEIYSYLIEPIKKLKLKCDVYGVRYPDSAINALEKAGINYKGWLPNYKVPEVFSKYKITVHIPRRPYTNVLKGIPTIRPFEFLACGIPMISNYWDDSENLFTLNEDYLMVNDPQEMKDAMELLIKDENKRKQIAENGLITIRKKHTCTHRVDELLNIFNSLSQTTYQQTA